MAVLRIRRSLPRSGKPPSNSQAPVSRDSSCIVPNIGPTGRGCPGWRDGFGKGQPVIVVVA